MLETQEATEELVVAKAGTTSAIKLSSMGLHIHECIVDKYPWASTDTNKWLNKGLMMKNE